MGTSKRDTPIRKVFRFFIYVVLIVGGLVLAADVTGWQAGHSVLITRVYSVDNGKVNTDVGYLAQRLYGRSYWVRSDIMERIRVGCIYQLTISYRFSAKIKVYLTGDPGLPYLENVIGGLEEPERGCVDLYKGQTFPRRMYGKDNRCPYLPSKFDFYPSCG